MMMKWGRKKPSSSSSRLHSLSRVLPTAWLSTFKRMSIHSESKPAKEKKTVMRNSVSVSSSKFAGGGERFYGGDGEAFWRLSFGEDTTDGKTSKSVSQSAWNDPDDEPNFAPPHYRGCGSNAMRRKEKEETKKFSNMACNVEKMKEFRWDTQIFPDMNVYRGEEVTVVKTPRSRMITEKDLKKANERAMKERRLKRQNKSGEAQQKSLAKKTLEPEVVRAIPMTERQNQKLTSDYQRMHQHMSTLNLRTSNLTTINEDSAFTTQKLVETDTLSPEKLSPEVGEWKEMKFEKVKVKSEKQRKSLYISRELPRKRMKQISKVRAFSPRTASRVEICKIKALEDIKKAKLKMKAAKQKTISGKTGLENFAMVKCSFDPEKDFRDSMIEMIMEKRISQPEELEELLACYLTLNSDVYHDLIIKVFQQVWFDLDQGSWDTGLQNEQCSSG